MHHLKQNMTERTSSDPLFVLKGAHGSAPADAASQSAPNQAVKQGWFKRLRHGLKRSTGALGSSIAVVLSHSKLDANALDDLEDALISSDIGIETACALVEKMREQRFAPNVREEEIRAFLANHIETILKPVQEALVIDPSHRPHVILMVGVNGSGKTTTIGKLANSLHGAGLKVLLAAGDTFRAAAIDQLKVWGERSGLDVIASEPGSDPASLAFQAMDEAKRVDADVLLIDTAGRLQNRQELMDELAKIVRVIRKKDETAPHSTLLTLDATTGQNALAQVEIFHKAVGLTGLIMSKLDGTAKGGILVALAATHHIPVQLIGAGEGIHDLMPFDAKVFSRAIMGLETLT